MKLNELYKPVEDAFVAALSIGCPRCGAKPKKNCIGITKRNDGQELSTVHNERLRVAGYGSAKDFHMKAKAVN